MRSAPAFYKNHAASKKLEETWVSCRGFKGVSPFSQNHSGRVGGKKEADHSWPQGELGLNTKVPVLLVSGSMGSGKTTVLFEASDLLVEARVAHAAVDLDCLSVMYPRQGRFGEPLMFANLAAIWPIYAAAGAQRLLVAYVVEDRSELHQYHEAVPGAEVVVCRLTASIETMQERLRIREPGTIQPQAIARSAELADILDRVKAEDFTVSNNGERPIAEVAHEVLSRAGWL